MHFKSISDTMELTKEFDPNLDGMARYRPLPDMARTFTVQFTGQADVDPTAVDKELMEAQASVDRHSDLVTVLGDRAQVILAALSEATKRKGGVHANTP